MTYVVCGPSDPRKNKRISDPNRPISRFHLNSISTANSLLPKKLVTRQLTKVSYVALTASKFRSWRPKYKYSEQETCHIFIAKKEKKKKKKTKRSRKTREMSTELREGQWDSRTPTTFCPMLESITEALEFSEFQRLTLVLFSLWPFILLETSQFWGFVSV